MSREIVAKFRARVQKSLEIRVREAECAAADDVRDVKVVKDVRGGARPASHACPLFFL